MGVDGIFHIVRAFNDSEVTHVEGDVDPVRDLEIIHEELRKKDKQFIENALEVRSKEVARLGKGGGVADKAKKEEYEIAKKVADHIINQNKDIRSGDWNNKEIEFLNTINMLTSKPVIYLVCDIFHYSIFNTLLPKCNLSDEDFVKKKNRWLPKMKAWIDKEHPGDLLIPFSGSFEKEYAEKETPEEKAQYLKSMQEKFQVQHPVSSMLPKIVSSGYSSLSLIYCMCAKTWLASRALLLIPPKSLLAARMRSVPGQYERIRRHRRPLEPYIVILRRHLLWLK